MRKVVNKRGQTEVSFGTILLIILGVLGLLLVIYGTYVGWDKIIGLIKVAPSNLEGIKQSCLLSAQSNLNSAYCDDFKEASSGILGGKEWVNCPYLNYTYPNSGLPFVNCYPALPIKWGQNINVNDSDDSLAITKCKQLQAGTSYSGKDVINGFKCPANLTFAR